ncbi:MAG: hypothetical protein Ct9H300mP23_07620 [Nitrospinota bacterium]|nr:MAG: hypothetical protein Ct9H300mP23_07620 [Nitrospinota bacterium]
MSFGIPALVVDGLIKRFWKIFFGEGRWYFVLVGEGKIRDRKHWIAHTLKPAGPLLLMRGS